MFFQLGTSPESITNWVSAQVAALAPDVKYGWDVEVRPHKKPRTYQQNRFLMSVMQNIVRFYQRTGFMPAGLSPWAMRTDILKEYYKARFGVGESHKLDTKAFTDFIDQIQQSMVQESHGEYEIMTTDQIQAISEGWL